MAYASDGLFCDLDMTFHCTAVYFQPWYPKWFRRQLDSTGWFLPNAYGDQAVVLVPLQ
jgi:hypothetical protein